MKDSRYNTPFKTAVVLVSLLVVAPLFSMRASGENEPKKIDSTQDGLRFEDFAPILNNNVFNAYRQDSARLDAERERNQQRPIPVDRFALVGTMHKLEGDRNDVDNDQTDQKTAKATDDSADVKGQAFAFFTGTEPAFRSVIQVGQNIAGHTVVSIRNKAVTLSKGEDSFELSIGMEMSRQGKTEWKIDQNADGRWRTSDPGKLERSNEQPKEQEKPDALTGDKADILKQMMERRKQEKQELNQ